MKYGKKVYIILFVLLIIFFIIMFSLFGVEEVTQQSYSSTIILGDNNTVWRYDNKNWTYLSSPSSLQDLSWSKYNVFDNNKYIGKYLLWNDDDRWYAFDDDKNAIQIDGSLLGISSNYDLKVGMFQETKISDKSSINYVLKDNDLSLSSEFTSLYKIDFDIDGDSLEEEFYIMSNVFPMEFNPSKLFSIAFMVKDNQVYYIYNNIVPNKSFNGCKPFYNSFIDTNNDGVFEVILSCGKYSNLGQLDMMYEFKDNNFKMLISNE